MRRFLVLLLFAFATLQLVWAGVSAAPAPTQAVGATSDQEQHGTGCLSHPGGAAGAALSPCDSAQPCQVCGSCQTCHPAALTGGFTPGAAPPGSAVAYPLVVSTYLDADKVPGFRPPIR